MNVLAYDIRPNPAVREGRRLEGRLSFWAAFSFVPAHTLQLWPLPFACVDVPFTALLHSSATPTPPPNPTPTPLAG
jgi:hypothetical protein